jgi:hypothetical protein
VSVTAIALHLRDSARVLRTVRNTLRDTLYNRCDMLRIITMTCVSCVYNVPAAASIPITNVQLYLVCNIFVTVVVTGNCSVPALTLPAGPEAC